MVPVAAGAMGDTAIGRGWSRLMNAAERRRIAGNGAGSPGGAGLRQVARVALERLVSLGEPVRQRCR